MSCLTLGLCRASWTNIRKHRQTSEKTQSKTNYTCKEEPTGNRCTETSSTWNRTRRIVWLAPHFSKPFDIPEWFASTDSQNGQKQSPNNSVMYPLGPIFKDYKDLGHCSNIDRQPGIIWTCFELWFNGKKMEMPHSFCNGGQTVWILLKWTEQATNPRHTWIPPRENP